MQKTCTNPKCAIEFGRSAAQKQRRKELKEARAKLKTKSDWTKEAQHAFNKFIRERDRGSSCISCDRPWTDTPNTFDCGHYRSVGAEPSLRFVELNAFLQCKSCNGGHFRKQNFVVTEERKETIRSRYRENLIAKIGLEKVEWLEGAHEPKRYRIEDLKEIRDTYRDKLKELKREDRG